MAGRGSKVDSGIWPLIMIVAPFVVMWLYISFGPQPLSQWLMVAMGAALLAGASALLLAPLGWKGRLAFALVYLPVMFTMQLFWTLLLACVVHRDCI